MATTTQTEYTDCTVWLCEGEIILKSPFHEDWHSEDLCHASGSDLSFVCGFIRGRWGASATIRMEKLDREYAVEIDGSKVATISATVYDLTNAEQAAFCGYGVFPEPRRWR